MPISDARRKQLDDIVTKMDSEGATTDEIQAVVNDFTSKFEHESTPEMHDTSGSIPAGVPGVTGAVLTAGSPAIRSGLQKTAAVIAARPWLQRALGGYGGAALVGGAGAMTGVPGVETLAGFAGYQGGKQLAKTGSKAVAAALDTTMPRVAGRFAALPAGRALANTTFSRVLPGIGQALMALDAGRAGWWAGRKLADTTGADQKIGDLAGRAYNAVTGNRPATAIDPNDPIIRELMARQAASLASQGQ